MSFVLLLIVLTAFDIRARQENETATNTHFKDLANRVASATLGVFELGVERAGSEGSATSQELVYQERLRVPTMVRGQHYTIELLSQEVRVSARSGVLQSAPLFNLQLPPSGTCELADAVCVLDGTVQSSQGFVLLKYEYKRSGASATCSTGGTVPVNCITIG